MKEPRRFASPFGVLNVGMIIVACFYFMIGFFGYVKYGDSVKGSITLNLPKETLYETVRLIFALAIFLSFPLQLYVPIQILWPKIKQMLQQRKGKKTTINIMELLFRTFLVTICCKCRRISLLVVNNNKNIEHQMQQNHSCSFLITTLVK